jgi:hypothetical protein
MQYALIVIDQPKVTEAPTEPEKRAKADWLSFEKNFPALPAHTEGVEKLAENVWQIHLGKAVKVLGDLVHSLEKWGVPYRVVFLQDEPDWVRSLGRLHADAAKTE